jgi:hypothetical protein
VSCPSAPSINDLKNALALSTNPELQGRKLTTLNKNNFIALAKRDAFI